MLRSVCRSSWAEASQALPPKLVAVGLGIALAEQALAQGAASIISTIDVQITIVLILFILNDSFLNLPVNLSTTLHNLS